MIYRRFLQKSVVLNRRQIANLRLQELAGIQQHFLAFFKVNAIISSRNIQASVFEAIDVGLQVLQINFGVLP